LDWKRRFDDAIVLPDDRQIVTLQDAGNYITKLPKHSRMSMPAGTKSAFPSTADIPAATGYVSFGRVEDGRGSLGHSATLRFPPPLIEPDVPD
jgi:hypothetical protein